MRPHSPRELAVGCPGCHGQIPLTRGLCGYRQVDAILLQSARVGVEVECAGCGLRFIHHRADPLTGVRAQPPQAPFNSI